MNDQRVKEIISKQLGKPLEQIENSKLFAQDLGADSLDAVSVILAIEDELGIEISDDDAKKMKSVQDAIDFVRSQNLTERDSGE